MYQKNREYMFRIIGNLEGLECCVDESVKTALKSIVEDLLLIVEEEK